MWAENEQMSSLYFRSTICSWHYPYCEGISSLKFLLPTRLKYFLELEVNRSKNGTFLSQRKYILDLLADTGKLAAKPCSTLQVHNMHLMKDAANPSDNLERFRNYKNVRI